MVWYGVVWCGLVGVVWFGVVWWVGLVWFGVVWCGLVGWFRVVLCCFLYIFCIVDDAKDLFIGDHLGIVSVW